MKFVCLLVVLALTSTLAYPQPEEVKDPKVYVAGGGSRKDGFDVSANIRKNIYESGNGRHSVDLTGGYSQHLGGPYGNSPADRRVGGIYTYRW